MMKIFFLLTFFSLQSMAGTLCEVYGISDSPQALDCTFGGEKIKLTCQDGTYYFGTELVEAAYHLEVEEGPTPLVFKTRNGELTVIMTSGRNSKASFVDAGKKLTGNCRSTL